ETGYLDSTSAMDLETLPRSLIVFGASAVGLELAQMFSRLGVRVTILEALPRIVPAEDPAIGNALAEYMASEGMGIHSGVTIERVERNGGYTVRFSQDGHAATVTAAENALTGNTLPFDLTAVPKVTFTDPQVASVGLTEEEIRFQGMEPISSELPLEHIPRALAARDTRGFVKLVADKNTRKILGAHILASDAGEMIAELALAVQFGLTIENLTSVFHPYLTLSEGIKLAAQTFDKDVAKLSCCAG
ncbi:FAD-dependent oxidoreductase, partial [candidate division KSB1 bacterium]|nr:FAD-dependent oxidoreductase [candidate division KSB1 bacterium]